MNWFLKALNQYVDFATRARRKEYWMFVLFYLIFAIVAAVLDNVLGIAVAAIGYGPIYGILSLALLLPSLAVLVRRLHDVGKSGWMFLIAFIPIVSAIWLFVLLIKDSQVGENKWGANPKEVVV